MSDNNEAGAGSNPNPGGNSEPNAVPKSGKDMPIETHTVPAPTQPHVLHPIEPQVYSIDNAAPTIDVQGLSEVRDRIQALEETQAKKQKMELAATRSPLIYPSQYEGLDDDNVPMVSNIVTQRKAQTCWTYASSLSATTVAIGRNAAFARTATSSIGWDKDANRVFQQFDFVSQAVGTELHYHYQLYPSASVRLSIPTTISSDKPGGAGLDLADVKTLVPAACAVDNTWIYLRRSRRLLEDFKDFNKF